MKIDSKRAFLRRKICSSIKTLEKAPVNILSYFFLEDKSLRNGDMIADESGNLWVYYIDQEGIYLMSAYSDDNDEVTMLHLE